MLPDEVGAQVYSYDPATDTIRHLGDLTEACGEKGKKTIVQGKSHVSFVESGGRLYFATHVGYYSIVDGMEKIGIPPAGFKPYPGGHFLALDMTTGKFEDLALAPHGDGKTLHYLTGGPVYVEGKRVRGKATTAMGESKGAENLHLVTYHIPTGTYRDHGPIFLENGDRPAYVNSIAIGKDGSVYTLSRITENGKTRTDLIRIPGPFKSP